MRSLTALITLLVCLTPELRAQIELLSEMRPDIGWGGQVSSLAVDPNDSDHVIAATGRGGLFRSSNGGRTWTHIDAFPTDAVNSLAFAPDGSGVVIATSRYDTQSGDWSGVWRSADGGRTWSSVALSAVGGIPYCPPPGIA